jgi:hypothetical protein
MYMKSKYETHKIFDGIFKNRIRKYDLHLFIYQKKEMGLNQKNI